MKLFRSFLSIYALAFSAISTLGIELTAEQQARLNALPPNLRAQAMEELEKLEASRGTQSNQRLEQPEVVIPRSSRESRSYEDERVHRDSRSGREAERYPGGEAYEESGRYRDGERGEDGARRREGFRQDGRWPGDERLRERDGSERRGAERIRQDRFEFPYGSDSERMDKRPAIKESAPQLERFGYDLFAGTPTTFAPATDIPVPSDYVIGPGDQLRIQFFGKQSASYDLFVSRDGVLRVPDLGPISVAGQSFSELKENLSRRVSEQMIGVEAFISMGELRSIRVFVLGDVTWPGSYTVSSLSTLTNALFVSGGINPIGSLRRIEAKRSGETVTEFDLYDLLLRGDTSKDVRLQPGDVIFVPPAGMLVGVSGEVKRPAIYELKNEETIGDVVALAGGFTARAYTSLTQIERITESGLKQVIDVDLSKPQNLQTPLKDGDIAHVYSNLDRTDDVVLVSGMVERPGKYQWSDNMKVRDIFSSYKTLVPNADLQYALIVSTDPQDGRIYTRSFSLESALASSSSPHNLPLFPKDRILVFDSRSEERFALEPVIERLQQQATSVNPEQVVQITGEVRHPGEYPLDIEMKVEDLVRAAGGFAQQAYTLEVELVRFVDNQKTQRETVLIPINLDDPRSADIKLMPFDQIAVKRVPEWNEVESVVLTGEVRFPGTYTIERGETLSQIIERAGGLTALAHPPSAVFLRESLRKSEAEQLKKLQTRLRDDIRATSIQTQETETATIQTAEELLDQLEMTEAVGRLVIDLPRILADATGSDVTLKGGDELIIPQKPESVTIIGSVNYPTSHLYDPSLDRNDYINLSGGFLDRADKRQIYVVRSNGKVVANIGSRFFPNTRQQILPGDTIVVPLDVDRMRPLAYWGSVSQIIYQLALGAAAINSF